MAVERSQAAAKEIAAAVEKGKLTEIEINVARELYRKQATEGAMLYFLLTKLCVLFCLGRLKLSTFANRQRPFVDHRGFYVLCGNVQVFTLWRRAITTVVL